ncbi:MAG: 30S ribosome-binding factor RbfA [Candidatus Marinimicrobia bacterium]|nr:30S ribosome-binding factor RbfA [Candidatus Neomarinimicrobiota bacterium]MBL7010106.1 30S ribosome-binding factor RbfA [Candidatus Neomarinimicrobiota bacterium]MBL7029983.1 30S ribosome-binding factor RbfA [Candidatus Neomarinimicrobiota bacterium]
MRYERPFKRTDRVANEIQHILGEIQTQYIDLSDLGFITISHVKISPDLKSVKVFFSVLKRKKPIEKIQLAMNNKAKAFRKYLGMELRMKYTPELKFYYDDTVAYTQKLDSIFHDLHSDD